MVTSKDTQSPQFNGSDWQSLNRIVALSKFTFAQDEDYIKPGSAQPKQIAHVAAQFTGPALDWAAARYAANDPIFKGPFPAFVTSVREAFGIHEGNITALLRTELDALKWQPDVPVFFAEFDRLTTALGITSHETRIVLVEAKLPQHIKKLFAEQALSFANYDTLRERCGTMWALNPGKGTGSVSGKKPRCGSCGKKGHTASDCRGSKN